MKIDFENEPLVSVLVFGKKSQKLNDNEMSVLNNQTYKNLQTVIVPDEGKTIEGIIEALSLVKGEYVCFWDINNLLSKDFIRALTVAANDSGADFVLSDISKLDDGKYMAYNLDPLRRENLSKKGEEIRSYFVQYWFRYWGVYDVWNKMIRSSIIPSILECLNIYSTYKNNDEGFQTISRYVLSFSIWNSATYLINEHNVYAYCRRAPRMTSAPLKTIRQFKKLYEILFCALRMNDVDDRDLRIYLGRFVASEFSLDLRNNAIYNELKYFSAEPTYLQKSDQYFYSAETKVPNIFHVEERLKLAIADPKTKVVSFDMFDTLVYRPLFYTIDVFSLLNKDFNDRIKSTSVVDFAYLRQTAEKVARENARKKKIEEITIYDIYRTLHRLYGIEEEVCTYMLNRELETELSVCKAKPSMKKIFDLANYYKKTILISTDMYLPAETIHKILAANGYENYRLYLSSELKKTKGSGAMFKKIIEDFKAENCLPSEIIHIGDNYSSDFKNAQEKGLVAFHLNSSVNVFKGGNLTCYGGESYKNLYTKNTFFAKNQWQIDHYLGLRMFCGLVANKCFDYPAISMNGDSDFDANPNYVGYYCLGGLLLGLTRWLLDETKNKGVSTIHFVARDGWLLKRFYDIYTANMPDAPKSNYLYISRKSLFTLDINGVDDLLAVLNNKLSANASSPRKILDLLKPIIKKDQFKRLQIEVMRDYDYEAPFEKNINYTHFITAFIRKNKNCFDFVTDKERARAYFGEIIKEGDVLFDAGYTGRSESTLSSLLGFPVNAFYLHSNGDVLDQREQRFGFETKCFYPWRPNNTGIIREHVLMEYAPSVIGYDFDAEENKVVFGEFQEDVCVKWFTERLQSAALDFCRDFLDAFGNYLDRFYVSNYTLSMPMEYFLHMAKPFDRKIFEALSFEDDIGVGGTTNATDFWQSKISELNANLMSAKKGAAPASSDKQKGTFELVDNNVLKRITDGLKLPPQPLVKVKEKRKNKILLYSNELSWSGAPRSLLRICKVLLRYGYDVEVWSLYDGDLRKEYEKLKVPVKICDYNNADYAYAFDTFDLCIVNAAVSYKFYYIIQQYLPTVWYIREATNLQDLCIGNKGMAEVLQSSLDMVCVSEYAKSYIVKSYNENVQVVPNCVEDKANLDYVKPKTKEVVFLTLGTIEPRKGYDIIIEAMETLPEEYKGSVKFVFAGRVLDFCKDWALNVIERSKELPNVEYLGEVTEEEKLHELYRNSDVVVVASRDESCSLVALEGTMHGKPLIVTENTGAKYMVTDENGYIIKTADAQSLQESMLSFVSKSESELTSMGKASRERYEQLANMEVYDKNILAMVENKIKVEHKTLEKPQTDKPIIPIILATNSGYAPYAGVTIQSVLENGSKDYFYDFYIFYTELGEETLRKLNVGNDDYRITTFNISSYLNNDMHLKTCAHYTTETYYRFFCPKILPFYDKVIYLDCDLIVLDDISKMFEIDLGGKAIGAVHNYMNQFVVGYVKKMNLDPESYFNAGVLVIDTKKFAENKVRERAFRTLAQHPEFIMLDQDALNIVCKDDVVFIPNRWNVQWHHFEAKCDVVIDKQRCLDAYAAPAILHFTGKNKPWNDAKIPKAFLFWEIAQKTDFLFEILKKMQTNVYVLNGGDKGRVSQGSSAGNKTKKGFRYYVRRFNKLAKTYGLFFAIKKTILFLKKRRNRK